MEYHLILLYALCPMRYALQIRNPQSTIQNPQSEIRNPNPAKAELKIEE